MFSNDNTEDELKYFLNLRLKDCLFVLLKLTKNEDQRSQIYEHHLLCTLKGRDLNQRWPETDKQEPPTSIDRMCCRSRPCKQQTLILEPSLSPDEGYRV